MLPTPARTPRLAAATRHAAVFLVAVAQAAVVGCSHWAPTTLADVRERAAHASAAAPVDVRVTPREGVVPGGTEGWTCELRVTGVGRAHLRGVERSGSFAVQLTDDDIERLELWVVDDTGTHVGIVLGVIGVVLVGAYIAAAIGLAQSGFDVPSGGFAF